jgi:hypothetical protein
MVRPEETDREAPGGGGSAVSCCTAPAGESPARVSSGAPGSRPRARPRMDRVQAGRQEPLRREQERGPQHQVKPAASSEKQRGSRAAHVTAKATSTAQSSRKESAGGPSGVGGAARVPGAMRNRRGPSAWPRSGRGGSYKPKAKSSAVQRASEGVVVCAGQRIDQEGSSPSGPRVRGAVSKGGGNSSPAAGGRYGEA